MSSIELVVFDWDGTLMDSTGAIAESIQLAAADLSLPVPSREAANHVIGLGLKDALQMTVPSLPPQRLAEFVERYRVHYFARDAQLQPFAGAAELLAELRSLRIPAAIATGKSRLGLNRALAAAGWAPWFAASRCADEGKPKPDPWMLQQVCAELRVDPAHTVMIGDTSHDLLMAHAAGAQALAVTYGAHPLTELERAGALAYCDSIAALRAILVPKLSARTAANPAIKIVALPAQSQTATAAAEWLPVCDSAQLTEGGAGVRFRWQSHVQSPATEAFVVRFDGQPRAYLNQCRHVSVELDWPQGQFFDDSGLYIVCATHGALYGAEDGRCQGGPCGSRGLRKLECRDQDGRVWVRQALTGVA